MPRHSARTPPRDAHSSPMLAHPTYTLVPTLPHSVHLPSTVLQTQDLLSLSKQPKRWVLCCLHFTGEEVEAQGRAGLLQGLSSNQESGFRWCCWSGLPRAPSRGHTAPHAHALSQLLSAPHCLCFLPCGHLVSSLRGQSSPLQPLWRPQRSSSWKQGLGTEKAWLPRVP